MSERYAFVMMIREKYWSKFCRLNRAGKTNHAYVRIGFGAPKNAELIFFYVVKPVGEIQGYAKFRERVVGETDVMWKEYGHESCLQSEDQYNDLLKGAKRVSFIRFTNLREAAHPILSRAMQLSFGVKRLPRGGFYVNKKVAETLIKMLA